MVAYRRSRGIAILSLNISTILRWVISSMPWLPYSQESGPFPTVHMAGWAPGLVQTGRKTRKFFAPHCSSNPTVQPVASRYTIYAIPPTSHTEGDSRTGGEKIMKIILHEDICDTYSFLHSSTLWFMYLSPF
jgi:hypothetical protein